jgi:hypothetical protein
MRVKNLDGAQLNKCSTGSWLAHWERFSGQNAFMCFANDCIKRPSVGGLVQKESPIDKDWYVIPLCSDCNKKKGQDLDVWDTAKLIPTDEIEAAAVTSALPRSFSHRALERFPRERVFQGAKL